MLHLPLLPIMFFWISFSVEIFRKCDSGILHSSYKIYNINMHNNIMYKTLENILCIRSFIRFTFKCSFEVLSLSSFTTHSHFYFLQVYSDIFLIQIDSQGSQTNFFILKELQRPRNKFYLVLRKILLK